MERMLKCVMLVLVAAMCGLVGGCGASYAKYDINVAMDPSMRDAAAGGRSVTVDILGINEDRQAFWQGKPVGEWFSGTDVDKAALQGDIHTMRFTSENPAPGSPLTLKATDPIWDEKWKGTTWLVVMANTPGAGTNPATDQRKLLLPRRTDMWESGTRKIDITLLPGQLKLNTGRRTPKD